MKFAILVLLGAVYLASAAYTANSIIMADTAALGLNSVKECSICSWGQQSSCYQILLPTPANMDDIPNYLESHVALAAKASFAFNSHPTEDDIVAQFEDTVPVGTWSSKVVAKGEDAIIGGTTSLGNEKLGAVLNSRSELIKVFYSDPVYIEEKHLYKVDAEAVVDYIAQFDGRLFHKLSGYGSTIISLCNVEDLHATNAGKHAVSAWSPPLIKKQFPLRGGRRQSWGADPADPNTSTWGGW